MPPLTRRRVWFSPELVENPWWGLLRSLFQHCKEKKTLKFSVSVSFSKNVLPYCGVFALVLKKKKRFICPTPFCFKTEILPDFHQLAWKTIHRKSDPGSGPNFLSSQITPFWDFLLRTAWFWKHWLGQVKISQSIDHSLFWDSPKESLYRWVMHCPNKTEQKQFE